jgi:hypothetical protein
MRNVRKRATFFNFLLVFSIFFDFFIFHEGVYADLIARVERGQRGRKPAEKNFENSNFWGWGDAVLIDGDRKQKDFSETTERAKSSKVGWFSQAGKIWFFGGWG